MPLCTAPGRHTLTHIYTQVYLFQAFQPVSTELHNQRAVLFPQRSRIVCTHTMSCITVINHVEEITISTRQLQRAVARSNWILLIFPLLPLLPPESRLLLRQTNLEGWGNAIRRERRGENTLVWVLILNQTLMIIQSKLVPLFTVSNYCLYCQVVTKARVDLWTVQDVAAFCRKNKNLRLPLHCWPACQLQSMANIWGWVGGGALNALFFFRFFLSPSDSMFIIYSQDHHFHAVFPLSRGKWMSGNKWGSSQQLHINQAASMWCRGWH